jgi:hypothetical protein
MQYIHLSAIAVGQHPQDYARFTIASCTDAYVTLAHIQTGKHRCVSHSVFERSYLTYLGAEETRRITAQNYRKHDKGDAPLIETTTEVKK